MHLFQINCSVEHSSQKKGMEVVDEQQEQGGAGEEQRGAGEESTVTDLVLE